MKKLLFLVVLIAGAFSCVKAPDSAPVVDPDEVTVPQNFDWKTSSDGMFSISVSDLVPATVRIFDVIGGDLISSGTAVAGSPFVTTLTLPESQTTLFIQKISSNGSITEKTVTVAQAKNYVFTPTASAKSGFIYTKTATRELPAFDLVVTTNTDVNLGEWNVPYRANILIEGPFTKALSFRWGESRPATVYIRGNVKFSSFAGGSATGNKIILLEGSTLTGSNFGSVNIEVDPGATLHVNGDFSSAKTLINNGSAVFDNTVSMNSAGRIENNNSMEIKGKLSLNNSNGYKNTGEAIFRDNFEVSVAAQCENSGTMTVYGIGSISNSCTLINSGTLSFLNQLNLSASPRITNSCYLSVKNFSSGSLSCTVANNAGALFTCESIAVSGGLTMEVQPGSITKTTNLNVYNLQMKTVGSGSENALFSFDHTTYFHTSGFTGPIEVVHSKYNEEKGIYYNVTFSGGAVVVSAQTHSITQTDCNQGVGVIGGGVEDPDPDTPNAFFPSQNTFGTMAFEDMWPIEGDYDMNDLVVSFNIGYFEQSNAVSKMVLTGKIMAIGASARNHGLGLQLDNVLPSQVKKVTWSEGPGSGIFTLDQATGLETGSSPAVFPLFSSAADLMVITNEGNSFVNTQPVGGSTGTGTTFQVTVEFNTPVSKSNLTINNGLNFFLTVAGNRGKEVHLFGFFPTSKVNTSFFQTYDDNSLNGTYYSTAERFPWALIVPASFRYPLEKIPMHDAFIHYDAWISSNKQSYPDWYQSIEGYVNFDKLFPAAN